MKTSNELKQNLARYLSGNENLEAFHKSFSTALRDVHKSQDTELKSLVDSVSWEISDLFRGLLSENDLKEHLSPLLSFGVANLPLLTGNISVTSLFSFPLEPLEREQMSLAVQSSNVGGVELNSSGATVSDLRITLAA